MHNPSPGEQHLGTATLTLADTPREKPESRPSSRRPPKLCPQVEPFSWPCS